LENVAVVLGIIPAGSANGLATDLNIPKIREVCQLLLECLPK
jgi:diacylglycerol kinase family enzyme